MNILMQQFINVYHLVSFLFSLPKKALNSISDSIIGMTDKRHLDKEKKSEIVEKKESYEKLDDNLIGLKRETLRKHEHAPMYSFRYVIKNEIGKKKNGVIDAENIQEAEKFLKNEDYKIISIKPRQKLDIDLNPNAKIKTSDLSFSLTQLSTYIKAGIPLVDAVRILAKQESSPASKRAYNRLVYDLLKGQDLSEAMENQTTKFPKLLVNMIKTAELTGDLPSILDDMAEYYSSMEKTKKQMISAMTYPIVVLALAFGVLTFMLIYIVPKFVDMFKSQNAQLPWITVFVMNTSSFIKNNAIVIIISLTIIVVVFILLYKNVKTFRKMIQIFLMRIPVFGKIIIYNEVYNFTKTFASLLNHGVYITDSMEILSKITNNEVYKGIIAKSLSNLAKGDSISSSFKGEWAFPVVGYEMLITGENTGQLGLMMEKVSEHFQTLHKTIIDQLKSLIEPLMIVILAAIVGVILLSIVVPMFDIYGQIQ